MERYPRDEDQPNSPLMAPANPAVLANSPATDFNDPVSAPPVPSRYPDLEHFYETTKPRHKWDISRGSLGEWLLTTSVPDGLGHQILVYYDLYRKESYDQYDHKMSYVTPPDESVINRINKKIKGSGPPHVELVNNMIQLRGSPHIIFDQSLCLWINKNSQRIVSGLNNPVIPL